VGSFEAHDAATSWSTGIWCEEEEGCVLAASSHLSSASESGVIHELSSVDAAESSTTSGPLWSTLSSSATDAGPTLDSVMVAAESEARLDGAASPVAAAEQKSGSIKCCQ